MTILELEGHNPYSGRGYIVVPYLADTKIAVEFKDIVINTDYQLISGVVETSYNPEWGNVVDVSSILESAEVLINQIKTGVEELIQNGTITKDEGDTIIKEAEAEHEKIIKSGEEIKEVQEQIAKEKEKTEEKQEPTEEQQKKIETAKASMNDAQNSLKDIADKYGAKAGKGSRESDSYFQGLLPLVVNNETIQVKQIDGKGSFTFKTTDKSNLKTYSTTISSKKYIVVITTSNSTKEELEKAKSMVDNPTDGIVIYNHYDLKNSKLGYKVNFANNFFDGLKQADLEEVKTLYAEALNNKLDEAQNVIDWGSEIFKATTEINSFFQDLMNKVVLPESIWNPSDAAYATNKYKMQALDAGVIDGALEEIKSIPLLISLVVDYTTSAKTRKKINQAFSDFSFKEAMKSWYEERKDLYKNQPKAKVEHQTGKDVVAVGTLVASGGLAGVTKVKKGLNFVEELVTVVKKKGAKEGLEFVGKYNWALMRKYFNHIQDMTGRAVLQKQIDKLKDALRLKEYKKLAPDEVVKHRNKFTMKVKNKCIEDWELETGQKWPRYTENVLDKNGDVIRAKGSPFDAHHIIENQFEGPHEWWNMHPAKFPDEHQGGIHGAGSPSRELFR